MSLNMTENVLINCSVPTMSGFSMFKYVSSITYARFLNMLGYSYNNIIIVTNVIILEFLSA